MAGFTEESIQRVRDALDIVQVAEVYLTLKRSGSAYKALCPFHNEKTPSFQVNPELDIFKCFGCGEGGDIFRFVMKIEGVTFPEAVEMLAERAGVTLERTGGGREDRGAGERKTRIFWVTSKAMAWFEDRLADEREGRDAREYLLDRGFSMETIRAWRLGWAPDRYGALQEHLVRESGGKREAVVEHALEAGLLRESQDGDVYEFAGVRGRVIFPILDLQQRAIGFGGRLLKEDPEKKVGKYINSPQTRLFDKSRVLFGLNAAAKEIRLTGAAIVVEGYTDVIMCHQHGIRNVVATLGTALTPEHVRLLRRFADSVIARFDADEAGANATDKAIRTFVEADMPLRIIRSEEIKDACEFLPARGADAFRAEVDEAEDAFGYHFRQCFERAELRSVDDREAAVRRAMELVALSPNATKREMLRQQVASRAGIPLAALPEVKPRRAAPEGRGRAGGTRPEPGGRRDGWRG
ncbi:MAG: DNA primase, partial [Planctomycetota bacterium]